MKKYKRAAITAVLWILTAGWIAVSFALSWQSGSGTVGLSRQIAQFLLELLGNVGLRPNPERFHAGLRLAAHFVVFFFNGLLFALALCGSLGPCREKHACLWGAVAGAAVAVAAEVGKIAVPGRHLTWSETWLNVVGALCGAGIIYMICVTVRRKRRRNS